MWRWLQAWALLVSAGAVVAQHRADAEARPRAREHLAKDEPTCEQLKAMWRFSKRQARAPEIMNEVSSYRDPLMYNEWPVYPTMPRMTPRVRYQYASAPGREAYGRVVTKAPPNVVRTPDYDEMFGMLNLPHASGKLLRYAGPSRARGAAFMVPPQRDRFEALKKLIRQEHVREMQRKYETEQKQEMKDLANGRSAIEDETFYGEQDRGIPAAPAHDYAIEEPGKHYKKPQSPNRQLNQFSRYSDMLVPPVRRSFYQQPLNLPDVFADMY